MAKSILLQLPSRQSSVIDRIVTVFCRQIKNRCGAQVLMSGKGELTKFEIKKGIGEEGFKIEDRENGGVRIIGDNERGLLYGVGKFLRTSRYDKNGFTPGKWRGTSIPEKEFRGIYFATHFHNFYHEAPIEEVQHYVEELALWGYNAVAVWFDMHHFTSINDPNAKEMIKHLRAILIAARNIGIGTCFLGIGNEAYTNSPIELRADQTFPGTKHLRGGFGIELCPNKSGAKELMLQWKEELFSAFSDIGLDYVVVGPYDQGGCCCEKCKPWGANGYLTMAKEISNLAHKYWPESKFILFTWLFDCVKPEGEWEGLAKAFTPRPDWVDYIMADSHTDFPEYPLKYGVPGGLPLLNFPEISMWGMSPWGGYGANPLPNRFQRLWKQVGNKLSGGFPYSEGLYEDINKAIISQFYWNNKKAVDTVREYISFEYSPEVVDDVFKAIEILEKNHRYFSVDKPCKIPSNVIIKADKAYEYMKKAELKLSSFVQNSWRWRILFLRSFIDRERFRNYGLPSKRCEEAFKELTRIYHAEENVTSAIAPPTLRE
ncbi:MAG: hypothetical protein DDT40_00886 [candidate division WS2 bacterium]|nr:hypothetical protein [Candidatus Psychracetigena formicireducens]